LEWGGTIANLAGLRQGEILAAARNVDIAKRLRKPAPDEAIYKRAMLSLTAWSCYDGIPMRGTSERPSNQLTPGADRPARPVAFQLTVACVVLVPLVLSFALANERTWTLLKTSALLATTVAAISIPVGVFLAVLLSRTDLPFRRTISLLLAVQLLLPLYLITAAWLSAFGLQGFVGLWFESAATNGEMAARPLLDGARGAIWVHAMAAIPWVVLIVSIGLRLVEPELEEDALTVAPMRKVLFRVTLPRATGSIGVAMLWIAITTGSEMTATDLFQMRTFAEEVYTAFAATSDTTTAALQLLPGTLFIIASVMAAMLGCAYFLPKVLRRRPRALVTFPLRRWQWPLLLCVALVLLVTAGVPLLSLGYRAGIETTHDGDAIQHTWSLAKLLNMATLEIFDGQTGVLFGRELLASLLIGGIAAIIAVSLGAMLAWQARGRTWETAAMFLVVAACLAIPGPFIGKTIIWLLGPFPAVYDSVFAPALAQSVRALPLATMIMWYAIATVEQNVLDSAKLEGAGHFRQLVRIVLPMRTAALTLALVVALVISVGDLAASQMVLVPGAETVANRIFDRLHSGAYDQVCGVCLAIILLAWAAVGLLAYLLRQVARER